MKATIKIASAGKFTQDQISIIRRVSNVLLEHNLSVKITMNEKKNEVLPFNAKNISHTKLKAV